MCQQVSEPQPFRPVLISIDCVSQLWDSARGSALKFCSEEWQLAGETPRWRRRRERCRGSQLLLFHHHSTVQQREMAGSEEERDLATSLIRKHWKVELSEKLWGSFFQEKNIFFWLFLDPTCSGCLMGVNCKCWQKDDKFKFRHLGSSSMKNSLNVWIWICHLHVIRQHCIRSSVKFFR